jgi:hypothetical protein
MKKIVFSSQAQLEREKLLASGAMSDVSPQDLLHPHSDFHLRNRYLSRIGAPVSISIKHSDFLLSYHTILTVNYAIILMKRIKLSCNIKII